MEVWKPAREGTFNSMNADTAEGTDRSVKMFADQVHGGEEEVAAEVGLW